MYPVLSLTQLALLKLKSHHEKENLLCNTKPIVSCMHPVLFYAHARHVSKRTTM